MCIMNKKVCDGNVDCPGGQDEPKDKCNVNECSKGTHGCDHICVDTPAGFYCDCHKGYVYTLEIIVLRANICLHLVLCDNKLIASHFNKYTHNINLLREWRKLVQLKIGCV